jgi:hypothetical protein
MVTNAIHVGAEFTHLCRTPFLTGNPFPCLNRTDAKSQGSEYLSSDVCKYFITLAMQLLLSQLRLISGYSTAHYFCIKAISEYLLQIF